MNIYVNLCDELEFIRTERDRGASVQSIADKLIRSWDYVNRRLHDDYAPGSRAPKFRSKGWPRPTTTMKQVMGDRRFEDMPYHYIARERIGPTLNGASMARDAQGPSMGSTAAACVDL